MDVKRLKALQEDRELMDKYIKWREDGTTRFVLDLARDIALDNANMQIPPIPVQGVLTEICALRDRRTAGFVECLDVITTLDTRGAPQKDMPEEDYSSPVVDTDQ